MTNPDMTFQPQPPAATPAQPKGPAQIPPETRTMPLPAGGPVPPFSAQGAEASVTFDGNGITFDRPRRGFAFRDPKPATVPLSSVAGMTLIEPDGSGKGWFYPTIRTAKGYATFDPKKPSVYGVSFDASRANEFRALAAAVDKARPSSPAPLDAHLTANGRIPLYRHWWFWAIIVVVVIIGIAGQGGGSTGTTASQPAQTSSSYQKQYEKSKAEAEAKAKAKRELQSQADGYKGQDAAGIINDLEQKSQLGIIGTGDGTDQTDAVKSAIAGGTAYTVTGATVSDDKIDLTVDTTDHYNRQQEIANATPEQSSALTKAQSYSEMMHMSRQGIYDQLTSEYGEKFSPDAANWALDHLDADYNANALAKAKDYQSTMAMSPEAIRDQLTSQYGEKFTPDEANYAIEHLND